MSDNVFHGAHHIYDPTSGGGGSTTIIAETADTIFLANENLALYVLAPVPGTVDEDALFDGTREVFEGRVISNIRLRQIFDGSAGTTEAEVYRDRGGVFTLLATLTLPSGGGDFSFVDAIPAGLPLQTLLAGDFLVAQFTDTQTDGKTVTVELEFETGVVPGVTWIQDEFVAGAAQTVFVLSTVPTSLTSLSVYVNGVLYLLGTDFTVVGATLTWLNVDFVMSAGDIVVAHYL